MRDNIQRALPPKQVLFGGIGIGVVFTNPAGGVYMKIGHLDAVKLAGNIGIGEVFAVSQNQPIKLVKDPVISGTEIL